MTSDEIQIIDYVPVCLGEEANSYVNVELYGRRFIDFDLSHQFFNGANLQKCIFEDKRIEHTEFREAKIQECSFFNCKINSSDFVYSHFEKCLFVNCDFSNGEWLESEFISCNFEMCKFAHTTVSLCFYKICCFDYISSQGFKDLSVQYNIFEECKIPISDAIIQSCYRNFGHKTKDFIAEITLSENLFEQLSQLFFLNKLSSSKFINIFGAILEDFSQNTQKTYQLKAKYLSLICTSYIAQNQLSVAGISLLEQVITSSFAKLERNQFTIFHELFSLIFSLRVALQEKTESITQFLREDFISQNSRLKEASLKLAITYSNDQVRKYNNMLADFNNVESEDINYNIEYGSTDIFFLSLSDIALYTANFIAFIAITLRSLKVITADAKEVIINVKGIKKEFSTSSQCLPNDREILPDNQNQRKILDTNSRSQRVIRILGNERKSDLVKQTEILVGKYKEKVLEVDSEGELRMKVEQIL